MTAFAVVGSRVLAAAGDPIQPLKAPSVEYRALMPQLILIGGAITILVMSSLIRRRRRPGLWMAMTILTAAAAAVASIVLWNDFGGVAHTTVADAIAVDGFSIWFQFIACSALVLGALIAEPYLQREGLDGPEFLVLALLSASGCMTMAAANDLIVLFLGLEILSIALYVLAGYHRRRVESSEAAMKYFVLGAFSSALFLYGIALTYGGTGSTNLNEIANFLAANVVRSPGILLAGMALLVVGLGFKVAAVPFHTWTPDVYQGSPTPATAFMAAVAKAAGFAGLLRILLSTFQIQRLDWHPIVFVLSVATLVVGSVLAIAQSDVKRMLAYSSISHAGFILVGVDSANKRGVSGALFYLLSYTFVVMGSFAVISVMGGEGDAEHSIESYRNLGKRQPALALAFAICLMGQAGVPFTTGFFAKFVVFQAAADSSRWALLIVAVLATAVATFFYLRVIIVMYSGPDSGPDHDSVEAEESGGGARVALAARVTTAVPVSTAIALTICVAFTLIFGIFPGPVIDFAKRATLLF